MITYATDPDTPKLYRAGSIVYTRMGLFVVCGWLLWGDFAFTFMEIVAGTFIPLKLRYLQSPNWLIGLVVTTVPSIMGLTLAPAVSVTSDRTRTRWGRRIPYLMAATPFVTLSLIVIGTSDFWGGWLQKFLFVNLSPEAVTLWLVAVLVVTFQFFNVFITNIYTYLFNDVVPKEFLSRFLAIFKIIGIFASSGFQFFLFGKAESFMKEIFVGCAVLYAVAFGLMCYFVREGAYDPPLLNQRPGIFNQIRTYAKECFTNRLYWYFFLGNMFWGLSFAVVSFRVFFAQSVGLDLERFGQLMGVVGITTAFLLYPAAALADRWHPLRVLLLGISLLVFVVPLQLIFVLVNIPASLATSIYMGLFALHIVVQVLYNAALMPTFMRILPHDRFGQFCSAAGMISSASMIFAGVVSGAWLDWLDKRIAEPLYQYRYLPVWVSTCLILCLFFVIMLYREWRRDGGDKNYKPPGAILE